MKILLVYPHYPAIIDWMETEGYPFFFYTEASIELADDPQLLEMMVRAGFEEVFIGIETPHDQGLAESGKVQNKNRDLLVSVKRIQQAGLQVHGGFIVGFDSDPATIFEMQIRFIQESGIVTAMVGVLSALRGTKRYQRLEREGRLLKGSSGDNTAIDINFVPRMESEALIAGYQRILDNIYSPQQDYRRVIQLLKEYRPRPQGRFHVQRGHMGAQFKAILLLGVIGKERFHFRKVAEKLRGSGMFDGNHDWEGKNQQLA